jgi:hypothetical protein
LICEDNAGATSRLLSEQGEHCDRTPGVEDRI